MLLNKDNQLVAALFLFVVGTISAYFYLQTITKSGVVDFEDLPSRNAVFTVDVNQADWPELSNLPGIGERLAKQIIDYRDQNGLFVCNEQLTDVPGIGPAKLERMLPYLKETCSNH